MSYVFNEFVLDTKGCRLLCHGEEVRLERRAFDLLHYLITHRDRMVPKEELLSQVFGARTLTDGALSNTVAKLRRALRQAVHDKQPIETIHGRGYRFNPPEAAPAAPAHSPRATTPRDPFVGREPLLRGLVQQLTQLPDSSENLIVLVGEAGIGKTRTARELAAEARARGHSVWSGAAYEGVGAPPYWPWIQLLRSAHAELPTTVWQPETEPLGGGAWAVAQLLPELSQNVAAPRTVEPLMARFQLFDEVSRILVRAAQGGPRVLILDDLQSADAGTVELLEFVVRALQGHQMLFLATLRTGEPGGQGQRSPLERLGRVATVRRMSGLSREEVAQLATALTDSRLVDEAHTRLLHERTQGNPLFVRQALDLIRQRDDWSFLDPHAKVAELPPTILHVIRRRLVGLSRETLHTLEAAAVLGKTFELPILCEVADVTPEQLAEQLDVALQSGLIERREDGSAGFVFAHLLLRDSLYEGLSSNLAGALHARARDALARRAEHVGHHSLASSPRFDLGAIAHHALLAVPFQLTPAIDACRRAARAAQEASSFELAALFRLAAIDKLVAHGGPAQSHCRLLLELGEDQFYEGLIASAFKAFREAAEVARAASRPELLTEIAPRLVDCLELGVGDPWFARCAVDEALRTKVGDAERACLLAQRAELGLELPVDDRFALLDQAATLAEQAADESAILEVAHSRAILRDPTRLAQNEAAAAHFLALAERYPDTAFGMRYRSLRPFGAYLTRYLCALTACDLARAELALSECARIAETSHVRAACLGVSLMRAGRALGDGRLDDLQALIPLPLGLATPELPAEGDAWAGYLGALLEARMSLQPQSLRGTLSFLPPPRLGTVKNRSYVLVGQARLLAKAGEHERANALLAELGQDELANMPVQYGDLGTLCAMAEIAHLQRDKKMARALYPRLEKFAAFNAVGPSFEYRGAVAHFAGLMAQLLGHDARALFLQAVEINRKLGMASQLALSEQALAAS